MLCGAVRFVDGWTLVEDQLRASDQATGVLFTTSNGYLGTRGRRREPLGGDSIVLLAGVHETRPFAHPEESYGLPKHYQTLVAVTDPTGVAITVDGTALTPDSGTWLDHTRTLDLRTGCVATAGTWRSGAGLAVTVRSRRLASLAHAGLLWTELTVEVIDGGATVEVDLSMHANTGMRTFPDEPEALSRAWGRIFRPAGALAEDPCAGLVHTTALSGRAVACVTDVLTDSAAEVETTIEDDRVLRRYRAAGRPGRPLALTQRAVFDDGPADGARKLLESTARTLAALDHRTLGEAVARNRERLDRFWTTATVDLEGADDIERAVRFSTFQTFQGAACAPARGAPAKGLSGQGYQGHQMWDHEVYVGHALTYLAPEAARAGLRFRCETLPEARARAAELSLRGAQYPWRTIDGTEASAFIPAGAAQHHVAADIAWAIDHYVDCTGEGELLCEGGLQVLIETARLWRSRGRFDDQRCFRIEGVTGPDEYTAMVDNNVFTNLMAARNLRSAADRLERLATDDPAAYQRIVDAVQLEREEPEDWRAAAHAVVVPYDDLLQVHGQDDSFLRLPRWDLGATPDDQLPLQDHHHLLTLYRHQVLKQADVVQAVFLLADRFSADQRRRDFDYYEPLTTHDSSLSAPIHAVVAADVGRLELAWRYLRDSACIDLDAGKGSLDDGLHLASAAGSWLAVACGFGGLAIRDGRPNVRPRLPPGVDRLRFGFRFRGSVVDVETDADGTTYRILSGGAVAIVHDGELLEVPADGAPRTARPVDE